MKTITNVYIEIDMFINNIIYLYNIAMMLGAQENKQKS